MLGVIHTVDTLGGGRGGPLKAYWLAVGEGGRFNYRRTYVMIFFSQVLYKIETKYKK